MSARRKPRNRAAEIAAAAALVAGIGGTISTPAPAPAQAAPPAPLIHFRSYQLPVFQDHQSKVLMLEWSRQIGKSHTLAHWSVDRCLLQLKKGYRTWTVLVLSNSKENGAEFALKAAEAARLMGEAVDLVEHDVPDAEALSKLDYEEMRFQVTLTIGGKKARIKVLAANPRTARGLSGDLILDEFAFHEKALAIWEAAEPIVSANPEYLCRIASTHNGKASVFNQMIRKGTFRVNSMRRSQAWALGELVITSLETGRPVTPEEAEAEAFDRKAYRQNYENEPGDEHGALLPRELISIAQRAPFFNVSDQEWSAETFARLFRMQADEFGIGQDVGRNHDLSVVDVLARDGDRRRQVAQLVMRECSLAHQRRQMQALLDVIGHRTRRVCIDMTGLGTGLVDELTDLYGGLIVGCHFSSTVPITPAVAASGRKAQTMGLPERLALDLLAQFEDERIEIINSREMMDDLRKPGRVVSPNGQRVSIVAARGGDGHADRFWALALAEHAFQSEGWGAFDETTAKGVVMGGGSMFATPIITTFDPDAR